jgi:hypothetical protein
MGKSSAATFPTQYRKWLRYSTFVCSIILWDDFMIHAIRRRVAKTEDL